VEFEGKILELLDPISGDDRECEANLLDLFEYEHFDLIKILVKNRLMVFYQTKVGQTTNQSVKDELKLKLKETTAGKKVLLMIELGNGPEGG
jgi:pre-mRNA-splicing helicase BRR2